MLTNTKRDIEINRLTLGFMSYDKLKDSYKDHNLGKPPQSTITPKPQKKNPCILMQVDEEFIIRRKEINSNNELL